MKNFSLIFSYAVVMFTLVMVGCSSTTEVKPTTVVKTLADKVKNAWKVKTASENGVNTYDASKTTNTTSGWSKFSLDLLSPSAGKLTDIENANYTFTYTVDEVKASILLKSITPAINGGDYSYTAVPNADETELTLTRSGVDPKVGDKTVVLVMVKK